MLLTISYIVLPVSLFWLLANRKLVRMNRILRGEIYALMGEMVTLSLEHQRIFQEMISRVHHKGIVPISATCLGLIYVISLGLAKCIQQLQTLYDQQDWRTHTITLELLRLLAEEIAILQFKLKELNEEIKRVVNEYDEHQ